MKIMTFFASLSLVAMQLIFFKLTWISFDFFFYLLDLPKTMELDKIPFALLTILYFLISFKLLRDFCKWAVNKTENKGE